MSESIVNKVGLEAELFVFDENTRLPIFPSTIGLPTDDFPLLCEVRAKPGTTVAETVSNFILEFLKIKQAIAKEGFIMKLGTDSITIPHVLYSEALKNMGTKEYPACKNIYNTDISEYPDTVLKLGKIIGHNVGCGLHIHFSSLVTKVFSYPSVSSSVQYVPTKIPLTLGEDGLKTYLEVYYKKADGKQETSTIKAEVSTSRITNPVIKYFVETLDENLVKSKRYPPVVQTKYRLPGFYETKIYADGGSGFEYRSLPFNQLVFDNLDSIVKTCFSLLESL